MKEKLKLYIKENYTKENIIKRSSYKSSIPKEEHLYEESYIGSNINNYINTNLDNNNFKTLLFKYIDERNMKDSDVYNKVNIDRRLFSKIRCNDNYKPSKETIILLSLSLKLNINELVEIIDDYSVYNLFEPLMMIGFDDYQDYFNSIKRNNDLNDECIYRIKVYHLLKDSGYSDWYIEDNIERFTKIVMSFYKNHDDRYEYLLRIRDMGKSKRLVK